MAFAGLIIAHICGFAAPVVRLQSYTQRPAAQTCIPAIGQHQSERDIGPSCLGMSTSENPASNAAASSGENNAPASHWISKLPSLLNGDSAAVKPSWFGGFAAGERTRAYLAS